MNTIDKLYEKATHKEAKQYTWDQILSALKEAGVDRTKISTVNTILYNT